jgi:predicted PurR-regulated permease PerM
VGQFVLVLLSVVIGLLLGTLSNWFYDLLKHKGIFPDKPNTKKLVITVAAFFPLIVLIAFLQTTSTQGESESLSKTMSADELRISGVSLRILEINPSPNEKIFKENEEQLAVAVVQYYLPANSTSPQLSFQYLNSSQQRPNDYPLLNSKVIQSLPAEIGSHRIQMAGKLQAPKLADLNNIPFQVEVNLSVLDKGLGTVEAVASDKILYKLEKS